MKSLKLALLLSLMTLVGCSSLNPLAVLTAVIGDKPGLSVDTELVVGDKNQDLEIQVGNVNHQAAKTINNQNAPPILILLLVLGWVLPTPATMIRWMLSKIPFVGKKYKRKK